MKALHVREQLSRRFGIGARAVARRRSPYAGPPVHPLGHPHLGLRDHWYLLCTSAELAFEPKGMRVLGEDVVLWRDGEGRPRLMADLCPHRGARLSLGRVVAGEMQCWYHSWRFDGDGQCTAVPSQGGACSLQRRTRVSSVYPATEEAGFVWGWIGDETPAPLVLPEELHDPSYSVFPQTVDWDVNWMLVLENVADVMHAPFLHSHSLTLSRGLVEDRVKVIDTESGFRVERKAQQGVNFDWIEIGTGPLLWARLDIPYPSAWVAGPGPALRILGFVTPVDEARTLVHFPRLRQVDGWQRTVWRALYRARLRGTHLHVLNQDKAILESLGTIERATANEHLAQSDRPVLHLRKLLRPALDEQLAHLGLGEETALAVGAADDGETENAPAQPATAERV